MAGYSATPLQKKLGIKPGSNVLIRFEPDSYWDWIAPLPEGVRIRTSGALLDFVHLFVKERNVFEKEFDRLKSGLRKDGMLWVSWPKKSSKVPTDLDELVIRDFGLKHGMVDVKVCAVDATWSGLKFMFRLKDRGR